MPANKGTFINQFLDHLVSVIIAYSNGGRGEFYFKLISRDNFVLWIQNRRRLGTFSRQCFNENKKQFYIKVGLNWRRKKAVLNYKLSLLLSSSVRKYCSPPTHVYYYLVLFSDISLKCSQLSSLEKCSHFVGVAFSYIKNLICFKTKINCLEGKFVILTMCAYVRLCVCCAIWCTKYREWVLHHGELSKIDNALGRWWEMFVYM